VNPDLVKLVIEWLEQHVKPFSGSVALIVVFALTRFAWHLPSTVIGWLVFAACVIVVARTLSTVGLFVLEGRRIRHGIHSLSSSHRWLVEQMFQEDFGTLVLLQDNAPVANHFVELGILKRDPDFNRRGMLSYWPVPRAVTAMRKLGLDKIARGPA
jgi:hypothetical protein